MHTSIFCTFGTLPSEYIRQRITEDQWSRLMEHALCLACLDGNAFGETVDQYLPEAYVNLWSNNALGDIPNLYCSTAADAWLASLPPSHHQYCEMTETCRNAILDNFKVDPRGKPEYVKAIIDKATDVLGSEEKAREWVDHYSGTLENYPRRMAVTSEGTNEVLRHLGSISRHGHDA